MHKGFYASGFLYHPATAQILLHQLISKDNTTSLWCMFGGTGRKKEDASQAFQRITLEILSLKLPTKRILPVYDYFHNTRKQDHFVVYAQVAHIPRLKPPKGIAISWFTFKQMMKLPFSEETKQDIIVAERVIRAQIEQAQPKVVSPQR